MSGAFFRDGGSPFSTAGDAFKGDPMACVVGNSLETGSPSAPGGGRLGYMPATGVRVGM
jgi:hypothetical protein